MNFARALNIVFLCTAPSIITACNTATLKPAPVTAITPTYPARPTVPPPPIHLFHQDADTLTLTTSPIATDDEIAAILWQLRDATRTHNFAALHLPQPFIDARAPTVWFHLYRGPKCAAEKFTKAAYPCGPSYHAAADFTLGSSHDSNWSNAVLRHPDNSETTLWNPDAPATK